MPLPVRLQLGHAAVQAVCDRIGAQVLHVKGYALDESLRWEGRGGTDVDILVRPADVTAMLTALEEAGWRHVIGFEDGSVFGHAATLVHDDWGHADVHRWFPGLSVPPEEAFDRLWAGRGVRRIAGHDCAVPELAGQALLLILHAARSESHGRSRLDIEVCWDQADEAARAAIQDLVDHLGAEVAFAAAVGGLEQFRGRRDYSLWRAVSRGGTRFEEWWARARATSGPWDFLRTLARAPFVNVPHLALLLGRRPTRIEIIREFVDRPIRGVREQVAVWKRKRTERRGE